MQPRDNHYDDVETEDTLSSSFYFKKMIRRLFLLPHDKENDKETFIATRDFVLRETHLRHHKDQFFQGSLASHSASSFCFEVWE